MSLRLFYDFVIIFLFFPPQRRTVWAVRLRPVVSSVALTVVSLHWGLRSVTVR